MPFEFNLENKHILVTGASSGIGKATAILASQLGARVSLVARNQERLEETMHEIHEKGSFYSYDLSDVDDIESLIGRIVKDNGKFDGLMYSAGDCYRAPLKVCKPKLVQKSMQINYFAFVEVLRCMAKSKYTNDNASLVAMSSASSFKGEKGLLTLCASKSALNSAVKCAALELAPRKIRVNAIAAAYILESRMVDTTIDVFGSERVEKNIIDNQPLGAGQPNDVAKVATFLLSDAAAYMTGVILPVDGGYLA